MDIDKVRELINDMLRGSYTEEGIKQWWNRPRKQLDGLTPEEVFVDKPEAVLELARTLLC